MKRVVEEKSAVAARARKEGKTVHFGRVFGFCAIKHAELAADKQKYKGRVVFEGNRVRDEEGLSAVFSEQGSSASLMPAGKFLDAVSLLPECSGQQSDAISAYTQALLYGDGRTTPIDTWVSLPPDRQAPRRALCPTVGGPVWAGTGGRIARRIR